MSSLIKWAPFFESFGEMEKTFPNIRKNLAQAAKEYGSNKPLIP